MTGNLDGKNRVELLERRRKAVELRKAGVGYQEIAETLGYANASGAFKAVMAALKAAIREPAEELIELEANRLDDMLKGLWVNARKGNVGAVDRVLKIMQRRADLLGLDAPKTVRVIREEAEKIAAEYGLSVAEVLAEAEGILAGVEA